MCRPEGGADASQGKSNTDREEMFFHEELLDLGSGRKARVGRLNSSLSLAGISKALSRLF
jgi:hypothetical protein